MKSDNQQSMTLIGGKECELIKPTRGVKQGTTRTPYATKKIETVTINFRVPKVD